MFLSSPEEGDWVVTTRTEYPGVMSALTGHGVPARTRGVVTSRTGRMVTVELDSTATLVLPANRIRVTARRRGAASFRRRASLTAAIRLGAAAAILAPIGIWIAQYVWSTRRFDGMVPAFTIALVESAFEGLNEFVINPRAAIISAAIGTIAWWLAFGFPRRRG